MSHIHILFTMLIILNITTNQLTPSTTSKHLICYILMKFFGTRKKREKNAENAKNMWMENVENFAENCGF